MAHWFHAEESEVTFNLDHIWEIDWYVDESWTWIARLLIKHQYHRETRIAELRGADAAALRTALGLPPEYRKGAGRER